MELENESNFSHSVELNASEDINVFGSHSDIYTYVTEEQLKNYVSHPVFYHREISHLSEKMYNTNGQYGQTVSKMVSAPNLDSVIFPGKNTSPEVIDEAYNIMNKKLNHRATTRDVLFNSFIYGEYVAILRDTKRRPDAKRPEPYAFGSTIEGVGYADNLMLQPLDPDYVRFEGVRNSDHIAAFDLSYFDRFKYGSLVGEIKNYPSYFIRGYKAYKKDPQKRWLLLPQNRTFTYKYHAARNESHGRPLGLQAMKDIAFSDSYKDAQRYDVQKNSASIRYLTLPEGERTGSCSLNQQQQNNLYTAFKNAVRRNDSNVSRDFAGTTTLKLPPGAKIGSVENDSTFLSDTLTDENNSNISTDLGFPEAALNGGGDSGSSYSTLSTSIDLMLSEVFSMLDEIEWQYSKILNSYLGLSGDSAIQFSYLKTSALNRESQFNMIKDAYTLAGGSRILLYSAVSGDANLYMKLLDLEKDMDLENKYMPHITSFTASDNADNANAEGNIGGRPQVSADKLSYRGNQTRTNGGNRQAKPSTRR